MQSPQEVLLSPCHRGDEDEPKSTSTLSSSSPLPSPSPSPSFSLSSSLRCESSLSTSLLDFDKLQQPKSRRLYATDDGDDDVDDKTELWQAKQDKATAKVTNGGSSSSYSSASSSSSSVTSLLSSSSRMKKRQLEERHGSTTSLRTKSTVSTSLITLSPPTSTLKKKSYNNNNNINNEDEKNNKKNKNNCKTDEVAVQNLSDKKKQTSSIKPSKKKIKRSSSKNRQRVSKSDEGGRRKRRSNKNKAGDDSTTRTKTRSVTDSFNSTRSPASNGNMNNEISDNIRIHDNNKLIELSKNQFLSKISGKDGGNTSTTTNINNIIVGREKEIYQIERSFEYMKSNRQTSIVWINGPSGTGKSFLANQLFIKLQNQYYQNDHHHDKDKNNNSNNDNNIPKKRADTNKKKRKKRGNHFFFIKSKFDLVQEEGTIIEPLVCIKSAMMELSNQILMLPRKSKRRACNNNDNNVNNQSNNDNNRSDADDCVEYYYFDDLQQELRNGLGKDLLWLLSSYIPNLVDAFPNDDTVLLYQQGNILTKTSSARKNTLDGCNLHNSFNSGLYSDHSHNGNKKIATNDSLHHDDGSNISATAAAATTTTPTPTTTINPSGSGYKELSDRFRFAFQKFLQIVTSYCPLIWIIDDLQWADQMSLDMIRSWIIDVRITSFMVIGCYRSPNTSTSNKITADSQNYNKPTNNNDEVPNNDEALDKSVNNIKNTNINDIYTKDNRLEKMIQTIQQVQGERKIDISTIRLNNLSLQHVNELLSKILVPIEDENVQTTYNLAKVIHKKTYGNVFYVIQLLFNFIQQNLVRYNIHTCQWEWENHLLVGENECDDGDDDNMQFLTAASPSLSSSSYDVIELMKIKLIRLDSIEIQLILPLAACLGTTFSWNILQQIIRYGLQPQQKDKDDKDDNNNNDSNDSNDDGDGMWKLYRSTILQRRQQEQQQQQQQQGQQVNNSIDTKKGVEKQNDKTIQKTKQVTTTNNNNDDDIGDDIDLFSLDVMNICIEEGLLELRGNSVGMYCFIHDKIQEAAIALIPTEHVSMIRYQIGKILFTNLSKEELDQNCFLIANLMNPKLELVIKTYDMMTQRWKFIHLNYLAGSKAIDQSAFLSALSYFDSAIQLLPTDSRTGHWKEYHTIYIDLYSSAAECSSVIGNFERTQYYCSKVLEYDNNNNNNKKTEHHHPPLTIFDKVRVYHVLMDSLLNAVDSKRKLSAPVTVGLKILKELDCTFPKSSIMLGLVTIRNLFKAKKNAQSIWTEDVINTLPFSTNDMDVYTMKVISKFMVVTYICQPELLPLVVLKSVAMTLERGITIYSPPAFATLGMIISCFMGDFNVGESLALHSLRIVARLQSTGRNRIAECQTILTAYSFVLHWTKPIQSCRVPFLESYQIGMRMGDTESALWAATYYCEFSIHQGSSLSTIEVETQSFSKIAEDYGYTMQRDCLNLYHQIVLKLQGKYIQRKNKNDVKNNNTNDRTNLNGTNVPLTNDDGNGDGDDDDNKVDDEIDILLNRYMVQQQGKKHHQTNNTVMEMAIRCINLRSYIFFNQYEQCATIVLRYGKEMLQKLVGQCGCVYLSYYGGLSCYITATTSTSTSTSTATNVDNRNRRQKPRRQQQRKRKQFVRQGIFFHNQLKNWMKKGNPNCRHMVSLLDAEHLLATTAINNNNSNNTHNNSNKKKNKDKDSTIKQDIIQAYKDAITLAGRAGFIQDQALANERLAEFCIHQRRNQQDVKLDDDENNVVDDGSTSNRNKTINKNLKHHQNNVIGIGIDTESGYENKNTSRMMDEIEYHDDIDEAMYRLNEAQRLYEEWGATALVEKIESRRLHLL